MRKKRVAFLKYHAAAGSQLQGQGHNVVNIDII